MRATVLFLRLLLCSLILSQSIFAKEVCTLYCGFHEGDSKFIGLPLTGTGKNKIEALNGIRQQCRQSLYGTEIGNDPLTTEILSSDDPDTLDTWLENHCNRTTHSSRLGGRERTADNFKYHSVNEMQVLD